jgi:hypothetical protein
LRRTEDLNSDPQDHRREIRAEEGQGQKSGAPCCAKEGESHQSQTQNDESESAAREGRATTARGEEAIGADRAHRVFAG